MLQRILRVTYKILTTPNQSKAVCLGNLKRPLSFGNMQGVNLLVDVRERSASYFDRNIRNGLSANTCAAEGDTVLRDGDKEFAEDVVDVGGGEKIAVQGSGNFVAQALGLEELKFLPGMEGTEGRMDRAAQHAAAAAVGKLKLAARGDTSAGILIRHGSLLEVDLS